MAFDNTDFVDPDSDRRRNPGGAAPAPTREELDSRLTTAQQQLSKLRESHEQIEREIAAIEERRRRRAEFSQGIEETRQQLTRAVVLLEKLELDARREAEQLARTLNGIRGVTANLEPLQEEAWTAENWEQELSRGLAAVENARMELNAARLKWPELDGKTRDAMDDTAQGAASALGALPLMQLCRIGFALTWPLAAVALLALVAGVTLLLRR